MGDKDVKGLKLGGGRGSGKKGVCLNGRGAGSVLYQPEGEKKEGINTHRIMQSSPDTLRRGRVPGRRTGPKGARATLYPSTHLGRNSRVHDTVPRRAGGQGIEKLLQLGLDYWKGREKELVRKGGRTCRDLMAEKKRSYVSTQSLGWKISVVEKTPPTRDDLDTWNTRIHEKFTRKGSTSFNGSVIRLRILRNPGKFFIWQRACYRENWERQKSVIANRKRGLSTGGALHSYNAEQQREGIRLWGTQHKRK